MINLGAIKFGETMRIGARGSALAQYQARWVQDRLKVAGIQSEQVVISTIGDEVLDKPIRELGVQGVFTREIETALLEERIDLAVHSLKDMAMVQPDGLAIAAITAREDPADIIVVRPEAFEPQGESLPMKHGAIVGTSAVRRMQQALQLRHDLQIKDLRGNVPTRIEKLVASNYDAIFLAHAGVKRLGIDLTEFHSERLDPLAFIPSPGQGALAVEMRDTDPAFTTVQELLHDDESATATNLERSVLAKLGGGCGLPLGAYANKTDERWHLHAFWGEAVGSKWEAVAGIDPSKLANELLARFGV